MGAADEGDTADTVDVEAEKVLGPEEVGREASQGEENYVGDVPEFGF